MNPKARKIVFSHEYFNREKQPRALLLHHPRHSVGPAGTWDQGSFFCRLLSMVMIIPRST
jgi:hypothetical protein